MISKRNVLKLTGVYNMVTEMYDEKMGIKAWKESIMMRESYMNMVDKCTTTMFGNA